ncbi:hypothetical protein CaCOL14_000908 [Colletotrichum acutatum]
MGQFDWFRSIGATPEAVAVLNDQPILFTILLIVLVAVILQGVLLWDLVKWWTTNAIASLEETQCMPVH